jgi:hypothetical protein
MTLDDTKGSFDTNSMEVTISFLHPHGPSPFYVYPQQRDILSIHLSEVLIKVDPRSHRCECVHVYRGTSASMAIHMCLYRNQTRKPFV